MRLFVIILSIVFAVCCEEASNSSKAKGIAGSWKLIAMVKEPIEVDKITTSEFIGGSMIFNPDNSFNGEVAYPRSTEKNLKVLGTYSFDGGILTINNTANGSTTQSRIEFEKDFMIATPLNPNGLIAYYKRSN